MDMCLLKDLCTILISLKIIYFVKKCIQSEKVYSKWKSVFKVKTLNTSGIQSKKVKNSLKFMVNQFIIFYINIF